MRKIGIVLVVCLCAAIVLAGPLLEKPTISKAETWNGKHYMDVILGDGSKVELKSPVFLTKEGWQKLADDFQKATNEVPEPEVCPTCGQLRP